MSPQGGWTALALDNEGDGPRLASARACRTRLRESNNSCAQSLDGRPQGMKKDVVLRLLRGEPVEAISREVSVPIYRLEEWRERALAGMDAGLKERENDPLEAKLGEATRRIGELVMEVEILRKERQARHPLGNRRSSKLAARPPMVPASFMGC